MDMKSVIKEARRCQKKPKEAIRSQQISREAKKIQKEPKGAKRSQKKPSRITTEYISQSQIELTPQP